MDDDVRERLERIEARVEELAAALAGRSGDTGPAATGASLAPPASDEPAAAPPVAEAAPTGATCVAERCMHPGEPLTDANSMTVFPKGPDGEVDRTTPWPIHRACLSPARHVRA
jgi:hypothetical protein